MMWGKRKINERIDGLARRVSYIDQTYADAEATRNGIDNIKTYLLRQKEVCCDKLGEEVLDGHIVWLDPRYFFSVDKPAWYLKADGRLVALDHCPYCGAALNFADGNSPTQSPPQP